MSSSPLRSIQYLTTLPLAYNGDCALLGVSPTLHIYVEETYTEEHWTAQQVLSIDGKCLQQVDEVYGQKTLTPLSLPADLVRPQPSTATRALNYRGPRQRGVRATERIDQVVRPISLSSKMQLVEVFDLDVDPTMIIGLAESHVFSEAPLDENGNLLVCRRVLLAYALQSPKVDETNRPYDYDTLPLFVVHRYGPSDDGEVPIDRLFEPLPEVDFIRPMDCLVYQNHLFVADGGNDEYDSAVHIWKLER